jgi:hypothetical protein
VAVANSEPKLTLCQLALACDAAVNAWNIRWQVDNLGSEALKIVSVRLPHGQFKSDERGFAPPLELAGGESKEFQTLVHCQEPAGLVTENAFVIFQCQWRDEAWRIFVRLRVTITADGEPETATELITTQKIGFSRVTP